MGLLDDAIREHLELKRKHGASDEELERAELEALAPARRDPDAQADGAGLPPLEQVPGDEIAHAGAPADELEPPTMIVPPPPPPAPFEEVPRVDDPVYADEYVAEPAPADFDAAAEQGLPEHPPLERLEDFDELDVVEELEDDPLEPEQPRSARPAVFDDPFDESSPPPPARPADEDLLEETPEFLQETPEHDKLWFEQKPPRDFDFD